MQIELTPDEAKQLRSFLQAGVIWLGQQSATAAMQIAQKIDAAEKTKRRKSKASQDPHIQIQ